MRENAIVIPVSAVRRIFVLLLVLILLIVLVLVARTQPFRGIGTLFVPSAAALIDQSAFQAVFLTNGSTYFGTLREHGSDWFVLTDVFYLSVSEESGTQLIKRGSEAQGPKEPMIIPRGQVLLIENLRDDGEIVTAIKRFKSGQLPVATPPPPTPTRTATAPPATAQPSPTR